MSLHHVDEYSPGKVQVLRLKPAHLRIRIFRDVENLLNERIVCHGLTPRVAFYRADAFHHGGESFLLIDNNVDSPELFHVAGRMGYSNRAFREEAMSAGCVATCDIGNSERNYRRS